MPRNDPFPKSLADFALTTNAFASGSFSAGTFTSVAVSANTFRDNRVLQAFLKVSAIAGGSPTIRWRLQKNNFVDPPETIADSGIFTPAANSNFLIFVETDLIPTGFFIEIVMDIAGAGTIGFGGQWFGTNFDELPPRSRELFPSGPFGAGAFEIFPIITLRTSDNQDGPTV